MREYDLWLDESGDFEMDSQVSRALSPSIVGGVLMPKGALNDAGIRTLADPDNSGIRHALEMSYEDARRIVPAALEGVCNAGGKLVYFENAERIYYHNNRDLYMRVLAGGLAQLVRLLSINGAFRLNITVAVRYWRGKKTDPLREIKADEYRRDLKNYITREFEDSNFSLNPKSKIALTVLSARQEARLALADYATNAKLVLDSEKYEPVKSRLLPLIEAGCHFTVTALSNEASIRSKLAAGDISGALMEYYTARGKIRKKKMFGEIMDRFAALSYRLQRLQIRSFAAALRSAAARETDFERSEALLKRVILDFFGELSKRGIDVQTDESLFDLELCLADMYLHEGDILHAAPVMDDMEKLIKGMNYRVENLTKLYLFHDKKALYEINRMEYGKAVETLNKTIRTMEGLIAVLSADDTVLSYFGQEDAMASEYLGDAYCMKIYAELFMQREDKELFDRSLRSDTEKALSQYRYPGELERNQQYRSKAENEAGNCFEALEWLLKTQDISIQDGDDLVEPCFRYLAAAQDEDAISRMYYAMYYIEIMENASRLKYTELADAMKTALDKEKSILTDLLLPEKKTGILSDVEDEPRIFDDIFSEERNRNYHPREIALWKYGAYQWRTGSKCGAEQSWSLAVKICDENPDYAVLKLVALAILLEKMSCLLQNGENTTDVHSSLLSRCKNLQSIQEFSEPMKAYVNDVMAYLQNKKATASDAYSLSRRIAY